MLEKMIQNMLGDEGAAMLAQLPTIAAQVREAAVYALQKIEAIDARLATIEAHIMKDEKDASGK